MFRVPSLKLILLTTYFCGLSNSAALDHVQAPDRYGSHFDQTWQKVLEPETPIFRTLVAAEPKNGTELLKTGWIATCDGDTCLKVSGGKTVPWTSKATSPSVHEIIIDLSTEKNVNAIKLQPGTSADTAPIVDHEVHLAATKGAWGDPVAYGSWFADNEVRYAIFEPRKARFVRILASSSSPSEFLIKIDEIGVWAVASIPDFDPSKGRWGPTINFPIVPVGAFIEPNKNTIVTFSSNTHDGSRSSNRGAGATWTSVWDMNARKSSQELQRTGHDMFCPGMSFDVNGTMIITGGGSSQKTSMYNAGLDKNRWRSSKLRDMNLERGYQGSTTLGDGRIFVIGGSWSGQMNHIRHGEIFDPAENKWSELVKCKSKDIETDQDPYPQYRADNHVWLFGWKDKSVFHAGPAKDLHWITTGGSGQMKKAGIRGDHGAMCGVAVMYNAGQGKVLTAGGATSYEFYERCDPNTALPPPWVCNKKKQVGKPASKDAFVITLADLGKEVQVQRVPDMHFQRTFLNAVILPNGETFVAGGMVEGEPFTDETAQYCAETFNADGSDPTKWKWTLNACHTIPRTYHSFGLLLPDATVLIGGGGLQGPEPGKASPNHMDAQIYTPPYLLRGRPRPKIEKTLPETRVHLDATVAITTNMKLGSASLVRYGGATHTVNNDQRRISLEVPSPKQSGSSFEYALKMPENPGVAIPGYWMLFVLSEDEVPSIAKTMLIMCTECSVMREDLLK